MTESWQLVLLWGVLVGLGAGSTALVLRRTGRRTAGSPSRRGLVLGILGTAFATGQLVFLPLIASTIEHSWLAGGLGRDLAVACADLSPSSVVIARPPGRRGAAPLRRDAATPPTRSRSATRPHSGWAAARTALTTLRRAARYARVLAAGRHVLRLRLDDQRHHQHALRPRHARPRHGRRRPPPACSPSSGSSTSSGPSAPAGSPTAINPRLLLFFYYGLRGIALIALPISSGPTSSRRCWWSWSSSASTGWRRCRRRPRCADRSSGPSAAPSSSAGSSPRT